MADNPSLGFARRANSLLRSPLSRVGTTTSMPLITVSVVPISGSFTAPPGVFVKAAEEEGVMTVLNGDIVTGEHELSSGAVMKSPIKMRWYFDPISPFAYLHLKQFRQLPADLAIEYTPVLLAGLLKHWEHKGPAEIPAKRIYTYRYVTWLAKQLGIPFKFPPSHPFNSLHALRLLIAAGATREHVETAFDLIWRDGRDLQDTNEITALGQRLGIPDVQAALSDESVKAGLRANTDEAISKGVFGVPTFIISDTLFWGRDSLEMMLDYLHAPGLFDTPETRRASALPVGASRPGVSQP
jgi:2-hydroxychromene-2-carboxylate isomerase